MPQIFRSKKVPGTKKRQNYTKSPASHKYITYTSLSRGVLNSGIFGRSRVRIGAVTFNKMLDYTKCTSGYKNTHSIKKKKKVSGNTTSLKVNFSLISRASTRQGKTRKWWRKVSWSLSYDLRTTLWRFMYHKIENELPRNISFITVL